MRHRPLTLILLATTVLLTLTGCFSQEPNPAGSHEVGDMPAPLGMGSAQTGSALELGIYVVTSKDRTFYDIAEKVYGNGDLWRTIAEANPDVDQARLRPGQQIIVPEPPDEDDPAN